MTGVVPPGWSVRILFPKQSASVPAEYAYVTDTANSGTFTLKSPDARAAGQVTAVFVRHNFVTNPELMEAKEMAAAAGAWYWRYERVLKNGNSSQWDLNISADANNFSGTVKKINSGELSQGSFGVQGRANRWKAAENAAKATNSFGNMAEMLKTVGLNSSAALGYNKQIGLQIKKRVVQSIANPPQNLLAQNLHDLPTGSSILTHLEATFELNTEGLDMVYFTPPEAPPALVYQVNASAEQVSLRSDQVRRVEYGVCSTLRAIETNGATDTRQSEVNSLLPTMYALDLLSASKRRELNAVGGSASVDWDWYNKWQKSLKVSVLRAPAFGSLEDAKRNVNLLVTPNTGYLGKDRVDVLVEGKDDLGRPFALTLRYYLTVLNKSEEQRIFSSKDLPFKELCGKSHNRWRISELGDSRVIVKIRSDLAAWQRNANLSALIASAQQTLTGFTDLPATALGQTVGEGAAASITLDTNAAAHGWYVDPTPLDNADDYLPTSQAGVWQAKAGSAAANRMDMLSVLLHEYGHVLGLEHSAEAGHFMNASLQPGMRKMPTAEQLLQMSQLVAQLKAGDAGSGTADHAGHDHEHDHDHLAHTEHDHDQPGSPHSPSSPLSMLGLLPFGFVRRNGSSPTTSNAGSGVSVRTHDYMTAVNPTLVNGKFHLGANTGASGGNGLDGWESFGAVTTAQEAANTAASTAGHVKSPINLRAIC